LLSLEFRQNLVAVIAKALGAFRSVTVRRDKAFELFLNSLNPRAALRIAPFRTQVDVDRQEIVVCGRWNRRELAQIFSEVRFKMDVMKFSAYVANRISSGHM